MNYEKIILLFFLGATLLAAFYLKIPEYNRDLIDVIIGQLLVMLVSIDNYPP